MKVQFHECYQGELDESESSRALVRQVAEWYRKFGKPEYHITIGEDDLLTIEVHCVPCEIEVVPM